MSHAAGKVVLLLSATHTIGADICKYAVGLGVKQLIVVDDDFPGLFQRLLGLPCPPNFINQALSSLTTKHGKIDAIIANTSFGPAMSSIAFANDKVFRIVVESLRFASPNAVFIYVSGDPAQQLSPTIQEGNPLKTYPAFKSVTDLYLHRVRAEHPQFKAYTVHVGGRGIKGERAAGYIVSLVKLDTPPFLDGAHMWPSWEGAAGKLVIKGLAFDEQGHRAKTMKLGY